MQTDPRVVLAAERTLLAWVRTGLALMGFGFVVARFGPLLREVAAADARVPPAGVPWIGLVLVVSGVGVNVVAAVRYHRIGAALARNETPRISLGLPAALAVAAALSGVVLLLVLALASR